MSFTTSVISTLSVLHRSSSVLLKQKRKLCVLKKCGQNFLFKSPAIITNKRYFIIGRLVSSVLKLRYFVLGTTAGGGFYIHKKYEEIKEAFPDLGRYKVYLPEPEKVDSIVHMMRGKFMDFSNFNKTLAEHLSSNVGMRYKNFEDWLKELSKSAVVSEVYKEKDAGILREDVGTSREIDNVKTEVAAVENDYSIQTEAFEESQEEVMSLQMEHDKRKHQLEDEIKELRRQLIMSKQKNVDKRRRLKKSLIELYSEVIDELSDYDSNFIAQDHLPRVVVVGEQSAGKTSVLEMVAQARLFPRGAGSMMTRAPVKVTLAEGPFHVAKFEGEDEQEFDLSTVDGQSSLRKEIEIRMNRLTTDATVTKQPISISVRGPNLHRLVLVDLPGIISTNTKGMDSTTKDSVLALAKQYMTNPNAIILCVQDASKDAESSNIIDLVATLDPSGRRTIFVLTKIDQAESQLSDPKRIKEILTGNVFKMKARGYFAVVTGKGGKDEDIMNIKKYEEEFFKNSKLFREGAMKANQMTTSNLSRAVSDLFWKVVRESVEHQADAFRALKFNMENEWKGKYSGTRELDRNELFEKARGEILDNLISLSTISPTKWEDNLMVALWDKIKDDVFENIYVPAHESSHSIGHYKTTLENRLMAWAGKDLTNKAIDIGWDVMKNTLIQIGTTDKQLNQDKVSPLFKFLKEEVQKRSFSQHKWDSKADNSLKIIQNESLSDIPIKSKTEWEEAVRFLSNSLNTYLTSTRQMKENLKGPAFIESWLRWKGRSETQWKRCAVFDEVEHIIENEPMHPMALSADEYTAIKRNLKLKKIDVDNEFIKETWLITFKEKLLDKAKAVAKDCQRGFYHYHYGFADKGDFDCRDVVFFRRLLRMLETTSGALRNQIMNNEVRRMERIVKDVLEDIAVDKDELKRLLIGDQVTLAENIKKVREIQEKLDEFIHALNKDK